MDILTETVYADLQIDSNRVVVFTSNHRPHRVAQSYNIIYLNPKDLNPKETFVTTRVTSSSRHPGTIAVHRVPFGDKMLIRCERIVLPVTKSECGNYFEVESEDLDIFLWEESVDELKDAFDAVLRIMWRRYVMGDPKKMTQRALEFRGYLEDTYKCVESDV